MRGGGGSGRKKDKESGNVNIFEFCRDLYSNAL